VTRDAPSEGSLEIVGSSGLYFRAAKRLIVKLVLIAIGLLATTGVVYAACIFC
jgi:hypothetical protein